MLMFLIFFMKNVNFCLYPNVNVEYATRRCIFAIIDNSVVSSHYLATKDEIKFLLNCLLPVTEPVCWRFSVVILIWLFLKVSIALSLFWSFTIRFYFSYIYVVIKLFPSASNSFHYLMSWEYLFRLNYLERQLV